jgi:hypothetical protein
MFVCLCVRGLGAYVPMCFSKGIEEVSRVNVSSNRFICHTLTIIFGKSSGVLSFFLQKKINVCKKASFFKIV